MIEFDFSLVLFITGGITTLPVLIYFAPAFFLDKLMGVRLESELSLTIARHWALLIALMGILLIWAGAEPELRKAAVILATVEKAGMMVWLFRYRKSSWTRGFWPAFFFDLICISLYLAWLFG